MADSDDAEDAEDALSFAPPRAEDGAEDGDEPASADAEETKKKFRKPSGPAPLDDEGFAMSWDADEGVWIETVGVGEAAAQLTDQWIETRMAQVKMHLEKLQREGGVHGTALFSYDELDDCKSALTYALAGVHKDRAAAKQKATASAIFWAIALAQNVAARRRDGWMVDSKDAITTWSMDNMHNWLTNFGSEKIQTDEKGDGPLTKMASAKGKGKGGGFGKGAGGAENETKKRRLRVDALGDDAARKVKLQSLHDLIVYAGGQGLAQPVLEMRPPTLRTFGSAVQAAGAAAGVVKRGGARAKMLARWGGGGGAGSGSGASSGGGGKGGGGGGGGGASASASADPLSSGAAGVKMEDSGSDFSDGGELGEKDDDDFDDDLAGSVAGVGRPQPPAAAEAAAAKKRKAPAKAPAAKGSTAKGAAKKRKKTESEDEQEWNTDDEKGASDDEGGPQPPQPPQPVSVVGVIVGVGAGPAATNAIPVNATVVTATVVGAAPTAVTATTAVASAPAAPSGAAEEDEDDLLDMLGD